MKALVKDGPGAGLRLAEVPRPTPQVGEALIRVLRTGICGTDLHIADWDRWARQAVRTPVVVGHEFVGIVEWAPPGAELSVGTVVSGEGHLACRRCVTCTSGRPHLCPRMGALGVSRDGACAEFLPLPTENVWPHRPGVDIEVAALFDPLGNAVHAVTCFGVGGEDVLITGAGPVGLMAVAVARQVGARCVVVSEPSPRRREIAKALGATLVVDPHHESLADLCDGLLADDGFTVGLEMSGASAALDTIIAHAAPGCRVAALGLPAGGVHVDWAAAVTKMLTFQGVYGRRMFATWRTTTALLEGGLSIQPVITNRYRYTDHEVAFTAARGRTAGKVLLEWTRP